jgi:anti-sigma B factor antagonist
MEAGDGYGPERITRNGLLEIESSRQDGSWLVQVRGEIDLATVETLKTELEERAGQPIVLDLSGVEFMDSTGIALLIATAGRLTLGGISPPVERLIQVCGLEAELKFA